MRRSGILAATALASACAPQSAVLTEGSYIAFIDAENSQSIAKEKVDPDDYDTTFNVDCREFETAADEEALRLPDPTPICGPQKWPPAYEQWALNSGYYVVTEELDPWRGEAILTSEGDLQIGFHHKVPGGEDMRFLFVVDPTFQPTECVQNQVEGIPVDGNWIQEWSDAELTYIANLTDSRKEAFAHFEDYLDDGRLFFMNGSSYQFNPNDVLDIWGLPQYYEAGAANGKFVEDLLHLRVSRYGEPEAYNALDALGATDSTIQIDANDVWYCDMAAGTDPDSDNCQQDREEHVRQVVADTRTELNLLMSPTGDAADAVFAYEPIGHLNLWRIPDGKPPGFDGWAEMHANYVVFSGDSDLTVGGSAKGAFSLLYEADDSSTRVFVKGEFEIDKIKEDNWVTEDLEANKLEEAGVTLCIDS